MVEKKEILKALKNVMDPELGIDIVALGLVYDIEIDHGSVFVNLTLTSPGCPVAPQIMAASEDEIKKLKGVKNAKIEFVFDPPWSPDKMSDEAKMELGI